MVILISGLGRTTKLSTDYLGSAQISEFIPAAPSSRGTGWQIPAHVWVGVGGVTSNLERASMFHAYIVDEVHGIVNLRRLFCPV